MASITSASNNNMSPCVEPSSPSSVYLPPLLATLCLHFPCYSLLSLSLLIFASASFAIRSEFDRLNQCQLNNINALERDEVESGISRKSHIEMFITSRSVYKVL